MRNSKAEVEEGADPEDPRRVPGREYLLGTTGGPLVLSPSINARQPDIGEIVDDAMLAVEQDNPGLKGVLPKEYARPALDKRRLGAAYRSDQQHQGRR